MSQHFHAIVWIDHRSARIFGFSRDDASRETVKGHGPRHIHHKANSVGSGHAPEDQAYFGAVADALGESNEILIAGPGLTKTALVSYLDQHAPAVAKRVLGIETLDHPSDEEIVAFARKRFAGIDRTTPQRG